MNKGKVIGYIGLVLILGILIFLGVKYFLSDKEEQFDQEESGMSSEIVKYTKLICNKIINTDDYSNNNIISMRFSGNNLVWVNDLTEYYYHDIDKYTTAKDNLNAENSETHTTFYMDDYLTISSTYEGEIEEVKASGWNIPANSYTYDELNKYFKDNEYSCEFND